MHTTTILYKLTDNRGQTRGRTQWGEGVSHSGTGEGGLCGPGWIHAYTDPILAVLLNPIHANFKNMLLWECEGVVGLSDNGLKVGCRSLTTIKQLPVVEISTKQRVHFAILCAREVYKESSFILWSNNWLEGKAAAQAAAQAAADADAARAAAADADAARAADAGIAFDITSLAHQAMKE